MMGNRGEKPSSKSEHYTKVFRSTVDTPAFRALSTTAQALYPFIKLEWKGPQSNNNGRISLSYRQAADALGVKSLETVGKAFRELQAKGFIVAHEIAHLGVDGRGKSFKWEVTEFDMPVFDEARGRRHTPGTKLFKRWRPGHDFEVKTAAANNPNGVGGNSQNPKSYPKNRNTPFPKSGTFPEIPSQKSIQPFLKSGTE